MSSRMRASRYDRLEMLHGRLGFAIGIGAAADWVASVADTQEGIMSMALRDVAGGLYTAHRGELALARRVSRLRSSR